MAETVAYQANRGGSPLRVNVDRYAALRGLRVGCVKYLNSRPLIRAYDGPVVFDHPSALARMLASGELDAALVPAFEALRDPRYSLVDGVAVACDGPVFSVFLAYRGELKDLRSISLDPASLTSAHLLRVLLAEFHGLHPAFGPEGEAQLLIGNQAIDFRLGEMRSGGWNLLDLGEEWKRCTGLPFVFALWALAPGTPPEAADALREIKRAGIAEIETIIAEETFATPEIRRRYLTEHIRFDLDAPERAALDRYRQLLAKHGFIEGVSTPLRFV
jgi:chorismate dehydratase